MKTIHLHGRLGKVFGRVWNLEVSSPAEAIRAIEARTGKMFQYLLDGDKRGVVYKVLIDDKPIEYVSELMHQFTDSVKEFHFYPLPRGSGSGGILAIIGAVIFIAAVFFTGGAAAFSSLSAFGAASSSVLAATGFGHFFATLGLSMIAGGIYQMIAGTPKLGEIDRKENNPSFYFSGAINLTRQGGPIPLGYGEMIVGSQVISLAIRTESIGTGTVYTPGGGGGGEPAPGLGGGGAGSFGGGGAAWVRLLGRNDFENVALRSN